MDVVQYNCILTQGFLEFGAAQSLNAQRLWADLLLPLV